MILYTENPKEFNFKTTGINKWVHEGEGKSSLYKNQLYFYTLAMDIPKMKLIKQFHLQ